MRSLKEQFAAELANIPDRPEPTGVMTRDIVSAVIEPFAGEPYGELGAVVGMLEGLNVLMQTYHWKTNGDSFFGDHTLFQKIYEGIDTQIDAVGEKAVGLGSGRLASAKDIVAVMDTFLLYVRENQSVTRGAENMADALARRAKYAEDVFVETTEELMNSLKEKGYLTKGLDNLLAGILDQHEAYGYLLKQRIG